MANFFRHIFLPHHTNNYRAKLLHVDAFLVYISFFLLVGSFARLIPKINSNILGFATNITIDALVNFTNQKREETGLPPLGYNNTLAQAAAGKANDMFAQDYWAHNSPNGTTPWDFIIGAGYKYIYAGENLAKNFSDSGGVVEAWMSSSSHRENILRPEYTEVGFAVANGRLSGEETTLVVQMFGKPAGATAPVATATQLSTPTPGIVVNIPATVSSQPIAVVLPRDTLGNPPQTGVVRQPFIDVALLTKNLALGFLGIMMVVLVVDGIYVWRKNIVRISGRTIAHMLFLAAVTGAILLTNTLRGGVL